MDTPEIITAEEMVKLKRDVAEITDNLDQLQYIVNKKTGTGSNNIQGSVIQSTNFVQGTSGWMLSPSGIIYAIGAVISGTITAILGTIGGWTIGTNSLTAGSGATTVGLDTTSTGGDDIRIYAGDSTPASAPFRVTEAGNVTASAITITGGAVSGVPISGIPNSTTTDISLLEKTHDLVFSVTDADTIAWGAGTIVMSNGRTFTISAGNTGNMAALTYIYLDTAVSSTVLQTTTTYSTAMGATKSLLGMAKNNTVTATFLPYGAGIPLIDGADLGALSVNSAEIAASAVTTAKIAASAVTVNEILNATITGAKIAATTIAAGNIVANTITAGQIAALTITAAEIAASTITGAKIAATTIAAGNIVANTITAGQIAAGTITTNEIAALTIVAGNIAASTITSNKMSVSQLSTIAVDAGTLTAGSISVVNGGNTVGFTPLGTNAIFSGPTGAPTFKVTPAGVLTATGAILSGSLSAVTGGNTVTIDPTATNAIISGPTGAPTFIVTQAGALTASSATITGALTAGVGSSLPTTYLSGLVGLANTNINAQGWTQSCAFSSTDLDTVSWGGGTLTTAAGTAYTISAGNTGNMAAKTYIYFDILSPTIYQTTTTATTAVGAGKILVAVAQNAAVTATFALTETNQITGDSIVANTVLAGHINVTNLAAIKADIGAITAGSISVINAGNTIGLTPAGTNAIFSGTTGSPEFKVTPAGVMTASKVIISQAIMNIGGTGADGALSISSGTTTIDLGSATIVTLNYTSIAITGTGALAFSNPAAGGTIIYLKSQGAVTITSSATRAIDLRSLGGNFGAGGGSGVPGSNGTNSFGIIDASQHYGGGTTTGAGSAGARITIAEMLYARTSAYVLTRLGMIVVPGSGAGGGGGGNAATGGNGAGGDGGRGAGSMMIECATTYNCTGTIDLSGITGSNGVAAGGGAGHGAGGGGGGGGGGGMLLIIYTTLTADSGTYTVTGGSGGSGGAGSTGDYLGGDGGGGAGTTEGVGTAGSENVLDVGGAGGAGAAGIAVRMLNSF